MTPGILNEVYDTKCTKWIRSRKPQYTIYGPANPAGNKWSG